MQVEQVRGGSERTTGQDVRATQLPSAGGHALQPVALGVVGRHHLALETTRRAWDQVDGVRVVEVWSAAEDVISSLDRGTAVQVLITPLPVWVDIQRALSSRKDQESHRTPAGVVVGPEDAKDILEALRADVSAYVLLTSGFADLVSVVRMVARGYAVFPQGYARPLFPLAQELWWDIFHASYGGRLSRRQLQVVHLVALGLPDREIALKLNISPRTVEGIVGSTLSKLGLTSRLQLALLVRTGDHPGHARLENAAVD